MIKILKIEQILQVVSIVSESLPYMELFDVPNENGRSQDKLRDVK